ncbi:3-dehydroquinate synthase [Neptunomonas antarctica]|uniref:3-dehydroquinate synthase n=1 Tax=Neptunomonas antarctica TaxID=619304 RepID=A0A1N7J341_9GAMM|nr:3-dehydroquinate synthase [Neptunomonas antarctica]SIS43773.1 3-dehydroquinate synthase [Neptunomonas antarctica]
MQSLMVDLGERSYPIYIGQNIISAELIKPFIKGNQVMVVTNETIAPLYLDSFLSNLSGYTVDVTVLPDGESYKDLNHLNLIFDELLKCKHNRTTTLIALGGGVVGDMTGFAAASYQRGVDFIQVPTTLLSQVDSSVGGKTGVNHSLGKNMIGAFYQPQLVVADISVFATLPDCEFSAGLAEVIKYGLIYDYSFFCWLEENIELLVARDADTLMRAVYRSCEIKAEIVAQDEKEGGIRAWLNLGHTFGHAIETHQGYGNWLHGEAVAAGSMMALALSSKMGWLPVDDMQRARQLFEKAKLPVVPPANMTAADFMDLMLVDKKVLNGQLRLVLLTALGEGVVTADYSKDKLMDVLNA